MLMTHPKTESSWLSVVEFPMAHPARHPRSGVPLVRHMVATH